MAKRKRRRKDEVQKGPSGFFLATLAAGLLFLLWMVIQAIITSPFDDQDPAKPAPEAPAEASP